MEDFLKKVITGSEITPPELCVTALEATFDGAINADWFKREGKYEAIFYKDNIEYIALFDTEGVLVKYKMYLTKELLPQLVKDDLETRGEIMNVVLINEGNHILYEVIIRNQQLNRSMVLITQLGEIIDERPL